jgi:hypothetical protein
MSTQLYLFQGYTLVDITPTGVIRGDNDSQERNQQRNWETLLQCIGLRTQPQNIIEPVSMLENINYLEFGDFYPGEQRVWAWSWTVEREGVYDLPGAPLGGLLQDLEQVPIVTGLTETARFMLPIFYPYGTIKNIYIKQVNIE